MLFACISGISLISCSVEPQDIFVTCQSVETTTIIDSSDYLGLVKAKAQATITTENEGIISQILVKPGESVIAGTALFLLDSGSQIKAPVSGIVSNISVNRGEFITKDLALTRIVDNRILELNISVPTYYSSRLKIGLPIEIVDFPSNPSLKSQIDFISPEVNRQPILVKATFNNDRNLRDNQYVSAKIIWSEQTGILIPTKAISRIAGTNVVFVAEEAEREGETTLVAKLRRV